MPLIAGNHFQLIIEVAIIIQIGIMFLLNVVPLSLSAVLLIALALGVGLTFIFGFDSLSLFLPGFTHHEFTHPYGAIALLAIVTSLAGLYMMEEVGVQTRSLKTFVIFLMVIITIAGGLMHRSFLLLWILGLLIGYFIISKSFRQKAVFTVKRVIMVLVLVIVSFGSLELVSRFLSMSILSPLLRLERVNEFALPSLEIVLKNTTLLGHNPASSFWGNESQGFADGYISLPINLIMAFGLSFPLFYGILVTKKDVIDYFLPGIFGVSYDFGYLTLIFLLGWCILVFYLGFKILSIYREEREKGNKKFLGREALLVGSLTAFIAQALVGLFLINRSINGTALLTFLFLSAMVVGHIILVKENLSEKMMESRR
jgi:hypothetical protein